MKTSHYPPDKIWFPCYNPSKKADALISEMLADNRVSKNENIDRLKKDLYNKLIFTLIRDDEYELIAVPTDAFSSKFFMSEIIPPLEHVEILRSVPLEVSFIESVAEEIGISTKDLYVMGAKCPSTNQFGFCFGSYVKV